MLRYLQCNPVAWLFTIINENISQMLHWNECQNKHFKCPIRECDRLYDYYWKLLIHDMVFAF